MIQRIKVLAGVALVLAATTLVAAPAAAQTGTLFVENNAVRVEANGGGSNFTLLRLKNLNGAPQFKFENVTSGTSWDMSMTSGNAFALSTFGSGQGEFEIRKNGTQTFMRGPGGVNFTLNGTNGNLTIRGSVNSPAFNVTSSRETKQEFAPIDTRDILDRLTRVPISEWSFKNTDPGVRHIGPMAEDFAEHFVGNGKQLNLTDVQGVALAAIQGLNAKLDERDQRITALEAELGQLRELVSGLVASQ